MIPTPVRYEADGRVAVLTIDNPPVNALSPDVWAALDANVARAVADADVDAIVLMGAGTTFVAGSDIKVFDTLKTLEQSLQRSERTHALLRRLEDASKPLVAAVHGYCFGGGNELAMSCHYRVAVAVAKIGQPEVLLGIIPGAGGTQRLPRLCGVATAVRMSTDGKPIEAPEALAAGLLDRIVDEPLRSSAIAFARDVAAARGPRRTRDLTDKVDVDTGAAVCREARASLAGSAAGTMAALAAVEAIDAGLRLGFDEGSRRERELFAECVTSTESRALRHLFFAEREAARVPGVSKDTPARPIARAAVVGAGTMGAGIAMAYANADMPVILKDVDRAAVERGMAAIRASYESSVSRGRLTRDALDRAMALITPATSYDDFGDLDIVVEAVFEDMALKQRTFAELAQVTRPGCILASNTSTLDIDDLARASGRPAAVVGHHFFSPAHVMKLLEIVRGRETSAETLATSLALGKRLGKVGVVVGNCFAFVANRMLGYYMREAYLLLEEGAPVAQIDQALTTFGMPVGPFAMQDLAGIDVGWRIRQHLTAMGKTRADGPQSEVPDRLYELGRYGQKTGAGWYRYEPGSRKGVADPVVDEIAAAEAARRGASRRGITDDEIVERTTIAVVNEGARILDEGYATRAGDIDVIYCHGFGFPRRRGGPMFYADTLGLPHVLARLRHYQDRLGDYWRPAPLIERLVQEGKGFHSAAR